MGVILYDYQLESLKKMKNGCILNGGVGSGKSRTSLAYYFTQQGGKLGNPYGPMKDPKDLYIITTARKRDTLEWEQELTPFLMSTDKTKTKYKHSIVIDSWNNIKKYENVKSAFFIFDEQRVVGSGTWVKTFIKISKVNDWILLSATPGDTWTDYIPVFIANGFYKNRSEFLREHVVYKRYGNFPQIDHYVEVGKLNKLRYSILVDMKYDRPTLHHNIKVDVEYNKIIYKDVLKNRWNAFKNKPVENVSELCYILRKICNIDESRAEAVKDIVSKKDRVIIFYNFDYELEILKSIDYGKDYAIAEWNGHKHEPIPDDYNWVYLVQYNAGAEGWNCITSDTIIFYSQNYSYKTLTQAKGRIDRLNTMYKDLYYYHLVSTSNIDLAILKSLNNKKRFNESAFMANK